MKTFNGFNEPNYTQTPNQFFDDILFKKETTFGETKLLLFMIRFTFGWQRAGSSLHFSLTDIMEYTNMSRGVANKAIQDCLDKEYIERHEVEGKFYYRLKMAETQNWDNVVDWKAKNPKLHKVVRKSNQFENQTSSEIELVQKSNQKWFGNRTKSGSEIELVEMVRSLENTDDFGVLNKALNKVNKDDDDELKNNDKKGETLTENLFKKYGVPMRLRQQILDKLKKERTDINEFHSKAIEEALQQIIEEIQSGKKISNIPNYFFKLLLDKHDRFILESMNKSHKKEVSNFPFYNWLDN